MSHPDKQTICAMLRRWIAQRPGLEFGNYGDVKAYRSELRSITRDGAIAKQLLQYVEGRDSITAADMMQGFRAYSGRLSINPKLGHEWNPAQEPEEPGTVCFHCGQPKSAHGWTLSYCTGQYWPTEYRRAVCAVLSSVIWDYWRDSIPLDPDQNGEHYSSEFLKQHKAENAGDYLRRKARAEFGRGIADRFFR